MELLPKREKSFPSICTGFERDSIEIYDNQPFHVFWCPLCNAVPADWQDEDAWRYEHDMKEHPGYWAIQIGILKWK